jgi:hypothetical protein
LYCVWPALVGGVAWFLSRGVEGKTFYGSLTPGVDPVSPQGQAEFETRRSRDAEKRRIIYWAAGIIAAGYLGALLFNTFTLRASAQVSAATQTLTVTATPTFTQTLATLTPTSTAPTQTFTPTLGTGTPTYVPTATDRIVYLAGAIKTVIVTVIVRQEITVIVTATPIDSPEPTDTLTPTLTLSPTGTATPTQTPTFTSTATPMSTQEGDIS